MHSAFSAWRRLRQLPTVLRDCGAVLLVLGVFVVGAGLPLVTIPGALLPLFPTLIFVAAAFGRNSALLAALLAALAVRQQWFGPTAGEADSTVGLLLMATVLAAALAVSGLLDAWRFRRTEAVQAHAQVDITARRAAERLAAAYRNVQQPEVRLAAAGSGGADARRRPQVSRNHDAVLGPAFRSEGGI